MPTSDWGYLRDGAYLLNAPEHVLSDSGLLRLFAANKGSRMERTADGVLVIRPPVGGATSIANAKLAYRLGEWNKWQPLGIAFGSIIGYHLPNSALRSPDVSWVENTHWHAVMDSLPDCFPPLCPDFAAEFVPSAEERPEIEAKMREYLAYGMKLGWLLDTQQKRVEVYVPNQDVQVLDNPPSLSGQDVLPGFTLDLSEIFA